MKTKILSFLLVAIMIASFSAVQAASLFWDPEQDNAGVGTSTWTSSLRWDDGSLGGSAITWTDGNSAEFTGAGLSTANVASTSVSLVNLTVGPGADITVGRSGVGLFESTGTTTINATGSLSLQTNTGTSGNRTFEFSGVGITGSGPLSLVKSGLVGSNLFVELSGPTTTVASGATAISVSSSLAGLAGFVSDSTGAILQRDLSNSSVATTVLAATPTNKLKLEGDITGSSSLQIGSSTNLLTGTVDLNGGTTSSVIDVNGGTFLVTTALGSTSVTVDSGATLALGAADVLSNSLALTLNGGVFAASGFSDTLGSLTLTANSAIDFGTGGFGSITFGTIDVGSWTPGTTLSIWNWSQNSDHLFATTVGGFVPDTGIFNGLGTGLRTPQITFYTDSGVTPFSAVYNQGGWSPTASTASSPFAGTNFQANEIVPVPEPTAVLSMGMLLLAIGWKERRLFARSRGTSVSPKMALA